MMLTMPDRRNGFTVIELLIGVTILSVMIIPLYNVFFASARMDKMSESLYTASNLASSYLEAVTAVPAEDFTEFTLTSEDNLPAPFSLDELNIRAGRPPYRRLVEVVRGGDEGGRRVYCISVLVKRTDEDTFNYRASSLALFK